MSPEKEPVKKVAKVRKVPAAKVEKKAEREDMELTAAGVRKAKKAELEDFCTQLGLSTEGTVDQLRERLLDFLGEERPPEKKAAEKKPPEKKPEPRKPAEKKPEAKKPKAEEPAKVPPKRAEKRRKAEPEKGEEEEVEIEEEGAYVPKLKPKLSEEMRRSMRLRAEMAAKRPHFLRQEWFRYKCLGEKWRRPTGGQSKLRRHFKYRINVVSIGFRGPAESRGLHPSGFSEVLVHNPSQLEGIDPAKQAVRIAHAVGMRKRKMIEEAATEKGIRVLNRSGEVES